MVNGYNIYIFYGANNSFKMHAKFCFWVKRLKGDKLLPKIGLYAPTQRSSTGLREILHYSSSDKFCSIDVINVRRKTTFKNVKTRF